jgi:ferredoxin
MKASRVLANLKERCNNIKTVRRVIKIDEQKCNGCGVCIPSCAEGALKIIGGKAKLVSEKYCDGLGACLFECHRDAIKIEEREAEKFDQAEAKCHLDQAKEGTEKLVGGCPSVGVREFHVLEDEKITSGCESAAIQEIERDDGDVKTQVRQPSLLRHWPVQLTLVPAAAPFLNGADVVLAADCTAFADAGFHKDFLKDHALLVACPKLDDFDAHLEKLTQIIQHGKLKSLTIVHMEVPCCSGLVSMAKQAIAASGKNIPLKEITVKIDGDLKI